MAFVPSLQSCSLDQMQPKPERQGKERRKGRERERGCVATTSNHQGCCSRIEHQAAACAQPIVGWLAVQKNRRLAHCLQLERQLNRERINFTCIRKKRCLLATKIKLWCWVDSYSSSIIVNSAVTYYSAWQIAYNGGLECPLCAFTLVDRIVGSHIPSRVRRKQIISLY